MSLYQVNNDFKFNDYGANGGVIEFKKGDICMINQSIMDKQFYNKNPFYINVFNFTKKYNVEMNPEYFTQHNMYNTTEPVSSCFDIIPRQKTSDNNDIVSGGRRTKRRTKKRSRKSRRL